MTSEIIVVLDDDPTGSQAVADLPVLTAWEHDDFAWAFGTGHPAVYVLTNSRSLIDADAARVTREAVTNALAVAPGPLRFVSRSDSTLRGHFPLETDVIVEVLRERTGVAVDAVVLVPAFPAAGRVTVGGIHYLVGPDGVRTPAGETEFARDATFGYRSSSLAEWVAEKTGGRIPANRVIRLDLDLIRSGTPAIAAALAHAHDGAVVAGRHPHGGRPRPPRRGGDRGRARRPDSRLSLGAVLRARSDRTGAAASTHHVGAPRTRCRGRPGRTRGGRIARGPPPSG